MAPIHNGMVCTIASVGMQYIWEAITDQVDHQQINILVKLLSFVLSEAFHDSKWPRQDLDSLRLVELTLGLNSFRPGRMGRTGSPVAPK